MGRFIVNNELEMGIDARIDSCGMMTVSPTDPRKPTICAKTSAHPDRESGLRMQTRGTP